MRSRWPLYYAIGVGLVVLVSQTTSLWETARQTKLVLDTSLHGQAVAGAATTRSLVNWPQLPPYPVLTTKAPDFAAHHYVLLDVDSNVILLSKDADTPSSLASTTKIMTATLAIENGKPSDVVTVQPQAAEQIGSSADLRAGETETVQNLLYAALLPSGNDSAFSLADYVGSVAIGSDGTEKPAWDTAISKTVALMNAKARQLGLTTLNYFDPSGLDDQNVGSATDLARLAAYALKNDQFKKVTSTADFTITSTDGRFTHEYKNSNRLVGEWNYPGAIGVKTGFTPIAGHNLVGAVDRDGHRLVVVVMNTNSTSTSASADVARDILDFGWRAIEWR